MHLKTRKDLLTTVIIFQLEQKQVDFDTNLTQPLMPRTYPGFPDQDLLWSVSCWAKVIILALFSFPIIVEKIKKENCKCNRHISMKNPVANIFNACVFFVLFSIIWNYRTMIYFVISLSYQFLKHLSISFLITTFRVSVFLNNFIFHL